jgi:hypothetical protein
MLLVLSQAPPPTPPHPHHPQFFLALWLVLNHVAPHSCALIQLKPNFHLPTQGH